jgi:hypothetical protein
MNSDLQTIVFRDNPWLRDSGALGSWLRSRLPACPIPRTMIDKGRSRWKDIHRAHLLVGPRQAGKSTAIWAHLAEVGEPVLYVDCEQALVREWCRSAPLFLAELEALIGRPVALFFDEVQHLENAGLFVKGLVDRKVNVPVLVTGSSSYHLGAKVHESLAGRATRARLLPLAFSEVCYDLPESSPLARSREISDRLLRHVAIGGYPDVWLGDDPQVHLTDLLEAFILRDASDLFKIARPDAFRRLLQLLAGQCGSLVNLSEWASLVGVSRDTVAAYLEILEASHVTVSLPPFAGGKRSELTRTSKIYFVDIGIRNQLVHDLRPIDQRADAGPVLESWVFTELWKVLPSTAGLHYWRSTSKAEVDFVVARGDQIIGVEVKAGNLGRPNVPRSARSFMEGYRPKNFLIVSKDIVATDRMGATEIRWLGPQDVAAAVAELLR